MIRDILRVAFAFVGIIVGAGFASGQEVMQYFVTFGTGGLWGVALSAIVLSSMALIILQLGSYFNAQEHGQVFDRVSHPIFARILDLGVTITLFATGFVMFAGAGSNLNQQWGLDVWVGGVIMVVLVLLAGRLDVDKATTVIGFATPFIVGFIALASVYAIFFLDHAPLAELDAQARQLEVPGALPHWSIAALNYVGFNLMVAVSMAVVIGGRMFNPRVAGRGGFLGGVILSGLFALSAVTLLLAVTSVGEDDMPMLTLISNLNPVLGNLMAIVIFVMIFNTALGMFYALAKRLTATREHLFYPVYVATVALGFVLSFAGFKNLVGWVYPVLGYLGLLLIAVMVYAWIRRYSYIAAESDRRLRLIDLWRAGREDEFDKVAEKSNLDNEVIHDMGDAGKLDS